MPAKSTLALIVASPGPLQDSLVALMTTVSLVNGVLIADDLPMALRMAAQHRPSVVIAEAQLGGPDKSIVGAIKSRWPSMACVALVDDAEARGRAQAAGADQVLTVGHSPSRLIAVIEELLV